MMKNLSYDNHNYIYYTEFLAATVKIDLKEIDEKRCNAIYTMFNVDNSEGITRDDFRKAFNKIGRTISEE
eukprot:CAMPEP_0116883616 /NCGR_PEP_ID=MMETSP0463-20121206/16164_1 /TAXON_ID=181622 /ORGANISM="Strombidinopsis sp, Strain SopsisLIS2011" /LENGTH=69 /DNA_ID=CAMNT_0004538611 /DNA_START=1076 /DNA_END=1285 /DNA_ORIENTATION=-